MDTYPEEAKKVIVYETNVVKLRIETVFANEVRQS